MNDHTEPFRGVESPVHHAGWAIALRGVLAVIFGVIALRNPGVAAGAFVIVFAIYAFADGILEFTLAARFGQAGLRWGWYAFKGLVTVAAGIIALAYPGITLLALVFIIGIRAIILGVMELAAAFSWEGLQSRWLLGLAGVLSIVLGILLLGNPFAGGLALIWTVGVYAIVFGVMLFAIAIRTLSEHHDERFNHPAPTAG
jgi:uncharacterized membrane protein HdeD (DUF308 family)